MRRLLLPIALLSTLAFTPVASASSGNRCLLPGMCSQKQMSRLLFPAHLVQPTGCAPGRGVVRRAEKTRMVALTFDDGPWDGTDDLIAILDRLRVKASFFVVGRQIAGRESTLRRMRHGGHVIGNHSWSHPMLPSLPAEGVRDELLWTQSEIKKASGYEPCLMRPPYGALSDSVMPALKGFRPVLWDVDAADWERPPAKVIAERSLAGARPGSIILLHDGGGDRSQTIAAVPGIVKGLHRRGLRPVTLVRLLGLRERR